jgi:hypothetical protein
VVQTRLSRPSSSEDLAHRIDSCGRLIIYRANQAGLLIVSRSACISHRPARRLLYQATMDTLMLVMFAAIVVLTTIYMTRHTIG